MKDEACSFTKEMVYFMGPCNQSQEIFISKVHATFLVLNTPDDSSEVDQNEEIVFPEKK